MGFLSRSVALEVLLVSICIFRTGASPVQSGNFSCPYDVFKPQKSCNTGVVPVLSASAIRSEQKELNVTPVHCVDGKFKTATFGMGCFWGAEALYGGTKGVVRTTVGYAGGTKDAPTYRNLGDHTEVLEIDFDPAVVTYKQLLHLFWNNHEYGLTTPIKRQYMSLILYHDDEQKKVAEESRSEEVKRRAPEKIITEVVKKEKFFPAEDYHQKYRLQAHKELCQTLDLNPSLLRTSYVATKLNGYFAGVGGVEQFKTEVDTMGLTPSQKAYCAYQVKESEGAGLYCG